MRLHTTTALGLSILTALTLVGCSKSSPSINAPAPAASPSTSASHGRSALVTVPLSSAALRGLLLDEGDLGEGYTRAPEVGGRHDDVAVIGCPALEALGDSAAVGAGFAFPRRAKVSFTYAGGTGSNVAEEVYSLGSRSRRNTSALCR
ncbi:hypothetical protein [Streptomyces sp. A5-4]|uniref:hypothetical protein n=1 Tax=Streptomyces sp. A5-4 TaxID=3384771 RepID=UPI003DA8E37F